MADDCINALNRVFKSVLVEAKLSPTARKFFYKFNLRDVSRGELKFPALRVLTPEQCLEVFRCPP